MTDDSLLSQLVEEFTQRVREGTQPEIEEYACKHPELAERIRELFPTLMFLEGMAAGRTSAAGAAASLLSDGSTFGNYRIKRELGRGGMGIVYEAVHVLLEKRVALKVLPVRTPADAGHLERFFREAKTAAGLHHTNIVPVFDVGQSAGIPYFAMQYIEGRGLDQILRTMQSGADSSTSSMAPPDSTPYADSEEQPSPKREILARGRARESIRDSIASSARARAGVPERLSDYFRWATDIGIQAAEGLEYAHERKVVHRDIKPSNLLLDSQGVLWIADFGLARRVEDPAMTQSGTMLGTPRYMSPEQAEAASRPVDQRNDIYSLGASVYELLTLQPVFEGKTPRDVISQILTREPAAPRRLNPEIPADLATIVMKAMAKRPEDRYQSARELADDLQRWLKLEPIEARSIGPLGRTIRWCRRNPKLASVTAAAAAIIIALTGIYIANLTKKNQEIRTALDRAEMGLRRADLETKAIHAILRSDVQGYVDRANEVYRIDLTMHGSRDLEILPYLVNHVVVIDDFLAWRKDPTPELERLRTDSEEQALRLAKQAIDLRDSRFIDPIELLGEHFDDRGDAGRAEWLYREVLRLMGPSPGHRQLSVRLKSKMAALLEKKAEWASTSRKSTDAAALYREILQLRRDISPQDDLQMILERKLGMALVDSGQFEEAEKVLVSDYRLCRARLGRANPSTQMAARSLISLYAAWERHSGKTAEYVAVLPPPEVINVRELGSKVFAVSGDGPFSATWGGKEAWAFGHHFLSNPEGSHGSRSSSWLWSDASQNGDKLGPLQQRTDGTGQPVLLLPFTEDEERFNQARSDPNCIENCGERWSVWPRAVVPLPGKEGALLFYEKCFLHPPGGLERIYSVGTSIARWNDPTAPAVRRNLRPGTGEPTLLFQPPEPEMNRGALVLGSYLYAYGSRYLKPKHQLVLARVPLAQALVRGAWRFYTGNGQWNPDWQQSVTVTDNCCGTAHWNWYLGKLVYIWNGFGTETLSISTADRPEGPWSRRQEIPLGRGSSEKDAGIRHAIAHPELSKERGRVIYVTYQQSTGPFRSETRLVELVFK